MTKCCVGAKRSRSAVRPRWPLPTRLLVMWLFGVLTWLVAAAHASSPDPTWISGLYDAADDDDVMRAITDATAAPACARPMLGPVSVPASRVKPVIASTPDAVRRILLVDRGPPALSSPPFHLR